ncbi:response regulator transcription factor [Flavobacterium psychrotolerans]|uniref:DNA-binding response regulator n=1 Tax=Flavobacterium psychrotolerans TaxID=2169410 RepID=A0A2U1JQN3_9FLAO|nr:response regulator transcription factor [Flavobacterium psychrotolerans]PWA07442.1 DNA-binding response regulator [Flavobacterium psychrotolerans]
MRINVGIVEDERQIREGFVAFINGSEGFSCLHAFETAEEAIHAIPSLDLDVVLMDIHLPGKSGIECVAELMSKANGVRFIMCTSFEDTDFVFKALKAGATGYLTKTTSMSKMLDAIVEVYQGGSPMSSHIARKVVTSFHTQNKENCELRKLSEREKEILNLLSQGLRYKEIADKLFLSTETVRTHIRNIYEKLQVNSRTEALNKTFTK